MDRIRPELLQHDLSGRCKHRDKWGSRGCRRDIRLQSTQRPAAADMRPLLPRNSPLQKLLSSILRRVVFQYLIPRLVVIRSLGVHGLREKTVKVMRADFSSGRKSSAIVKSRAHAALDGFDDFLVF